MYNKTTSTTTANNNNNNSYMKIIFCSQTLILFLYLTWKYFITEPLNSGTCFLQFKTISELWLRF